MELMTGLELVPTSKGVGEFIHRSLAQLIVLKAQTGHGLSAKIAPFHFVKMKKVPFSQDIFFLELMTGLEPVTSALPRRCSTDWATSARTECSTNFWMILVVRICNFSAKHEILSNTLAWDKAGFLFLVC